MIELASSHEIGIISRLLPLPANEIPLNLPDAFPWGVAILSRDQGRILGLSTQMRVLYQCAVGTELEDYFHTSTGQSIRQIIGGLQPGQAWTGRFFLKEQQYGITSVEVVLQSEAEPSKHIWLTTLEHPRVCDEIRYSSRSELKMLRVLLDNTLEYIYFRDSLGRFILTNKAFQSAIAQQGRMPEVEHTLKDFFSEESMVWLSSLDRQVLDSGRSVVNEVSKVTLKSGLQHWLQLSIVPVRTAEGEFIGTLSVARDISDLKKTEADLLVAIDQARSASKAKGEFLAAMSHEIRTPINGIIGASELCVETALDAEQRDYIETVLECGNTLLALVNDVLDFSKIEAGQLSLETLNFAPRVLLTRVSDSFIQLIRGKEVKLVTMCDPSLPAFLMGDPTRLKQVLNNLISNAIKFTESGEIVLRTETLASTGNQVRIRFSVSDTGIGISKDRLEAIFDSFTQEDMSTTRKYGGTGLGLSISRKLVELMGGEITVQSEIGKGSVFSFEVLFDLGHEEEVNEAELLPLSETSKSLDLLLVEDNSVNQLVVMQRLKKFGHKVTVAEDSVSAIEAVRSKRFDCILMDIQMPGKDGFETTAAIREFERSNAVKPQFIVAVTAHALQGDKERCLRSGMDAYIAKPFRTERLKEVLQEAVQFNQERLGRDLPQSSGLGMYLNRLDSDDREDLLVAARILLKNLPEDIARMEQAVKRLDFNDCYFLAHSIRGSVAYFGQEKPVSLAADLERACQMQSESELRYLAGELAAALKLLALEAKAELIKHDPKP